MKNNRQTLPIGDCDSISQTLNNAIRNLLYATQPYMTSYKVKNALYLIDQAKIDLQSFIKRSGEAE